MNGTGEPIFDQCRDNLTSSLQRKSFRVPSAFGSKPYLDHSYRLYQFWNFAYTNQILGAVAMVPFSVQVTKPDL